MAKKKSRQPPASQLGPPGLPASSTTSVPSAWSIPYNLSALSIPYDLSVQLAQLALSALSTPSPQESQRPPEPQQLQYHRKSKKSKQPTIPPVSQEFPQPQQSPNSRGPRRSQRNSNPPQSSEPSEPHPDAVPFRMYESLHEDVVNAVSNDVPSVWFQTDADEGPIKQYHTTLSGSFDCPNKRCRKRSWRTGVIATTIRGYKNNGYNAVVYGQSCMSCNKLGILKLDEKRYVERVTRRIRIWAGIPVEPPIFSLRTTPPHETDYCEGCRVGICPHSPSRDI